MNILVMGAGAIGSFFGGILSKENKVILVGRKKHVDEINKNGLIIKGKTNLKVNVKAVEKADNLSEIFDLVLITVKAYDTSIASKEIKKIISDKTLVLSMQNGLDNIKKITRYIDRNKVLAGITTNGVIFEKPGKIVHTGTGYTTIGEMDYKNNNRADKIVKIFNKSGIKTSLSKNIGKEIWEKAVANSSINTLTTFFKCKNGYLLKNPVLERLVERICMESTKIARANNILLKSDDMISKTKSIIKDTSNNHSSMFQSFLNKKPLEIDCINGILKEIGKKKNVDTTLNEILIRSIKNMV